MTEMILITLQHEMPSNALKIHKKGKKYTIVGDIRLIENCDQFPVIQWLVWRIKLLISNKFRLLWGWVCTLELPLVIRDVQTMLYMCMDLTKSFYIVTSVTYYWAMKIKTGFGIDEINWDYPGDHHTLRKFLVHVWPDCLIYLDL